RLAEDQHRLAPRLVPHLSERLLRGDERRAQEALELAEAAEVGLERFDLVREVGALAPDVLEARGDLLEQVVGGRGAIAAEGRTGRLQVSDLDGCECHVSSPQA